MASKKDLAALTIVKISPELIEFDVKKSLQLTKWYFRWIDIITFAPWL